METVNVIICGVEDWQALYFNGELQCEDHQISIDSVLDKLIDHIVGSYHYVDLHDNTVVNEYVERNSFPVYIEELEALTGDSYRGGDD